MVEVSVPGAYFGHIRTLFSKTSGQWFRNYPDTDFGTSGHLVERL